MIIHVGFNKGGTRKTTVSLMLALYYCEMGKKVCLVDIDGQGDLSLLLGRDGSLSKGGSDLLFTGDLAEASILPANEWACKVDISDKLFFIPAIHAKMADVNKTQSTDLIKNFKRNLTELDKQFDVVICDTPPTLVLSQMASVAAAHKVVMPLNADFIGCGAEKVKQYHLMYQVMKKKFNPNIGIPAVILACVNAKGKQSRDYIEWAKSSFGNRIVDRYIDDSAAVHNALIERRAVWAKASSGNDRAKGAAYRRVIESLVQKIEG